jgi:plasmid stability protein
MSLWSFQGAREPAPAVQRKAAKHSRSLKTQQRDVEVDVVLGESVCRTAEAIDGTDAYRSKALRYP